MFRTSLLLAVCVSAVLCVLFASRRAVPMDANETAHAVFDTWGWIKVPSAKHDLWLVIVHDTLHTGRIKLWVLGQKHPVQLAEDTFTMRSLTPVVSSWKMRRDPSDAFAFLGGDNPEFLANMRWAVYQIDKLPVPGEHLENIRFGYSANPYQLLTDTKSVDAFRDGCRNDPFPALTKGVGNFIKRVEKGEWWRTGLE